MLDLEPRVHFVGATAGGPGIGVGAHLSIVRETVTVSDLVGEIEQNMEGQNQSLAEVSLAIGELNGSIQTNAAAAEELSAMAEELNRQSEILQESCNYFRS